jgi:zinc/manganese transport system ATP-binding protein
VRGAPPAPPAALTVESVRVALGGRPVLADVSFRIDPGTFCGLIGTNGAGKTTLLRVILGLLAPDGGRVLVDGSVLGRRHRSVGYVPQKVTLDPDLPMRTRDLVELGIDGHQFGIRRRSAVRKAVVDEMLSAVGADRFADARVGRLSGGEQQRALIAHALVSRPRLLLLDEPLANLDLSSGQEIVSLLAGIVEGHGIAVLLSAHDVNPLLPVMDQVVYLAGGRAASGSTDEVIRSDVLTGLYGHPVEVLRVAGRVLVAAGPGPAGPDTHYGVAEAGGRW